MRKILNEYVRKFQKNHRNHRRYLVLLMLLAVCTITAVGWGMHQKGIAMSEDASLNMDSQVTEEIQTEENEVEEDENINRIGDDGVIRPQAEMAAADTDLHEEQMDEDGAITADEESNHVEEENAASGASKKENDPVSYSNRDTLNSMSTQLTGLSGSGTKYDANGNLYSSNLRIDFSFDPAEVKNTGLSYYYEYPEGIIIPDGLLDGVKHDLYDGNGAKAGTYHFEKTEDGSYRVRVDFDESYVDQADDAITGYIQFAGQVDADQADDDGNIKIVGKDNVTLDIPKEEITYPENSTNRYEINTTKGGSYSVQDGKLVYTVYVSSVKGTPGEIDFEDTVNTNGLTLSNPTVKVSQETVKRYKQESGSEEDDLRNIESTDITVSFSYNNGKLSLTLPKIEPAQEVENPSGLPYKEYTRYKIEYTYDVAGLADGTNVVNNTVATVSGNNTTEVKSTADAKVTIKNQYTIKKSGSFDQANDQIEWKITLNDNKLDIAGASLSDDMLAKLAKGTGVTISPNSGYTIRKDSDGNITGITFDPLENGKNQNKYTISYRTPAESEWEDKVVSNTAKFRPENGEAIDSTTNVTVSGGTVEKKVEDATAAEDGKTAEVNWKVIVDVSEDGIPAGTKITDDPTKDKNGSAGCRQYFTRQQVIDWVSGVYWADAEGNKIGDNLVLTEAADITFAASDGQSYSWQEIKNDTDGKFDDLTYSVAAVTLKQNLKGPEGTKKLIFTYKTTADLESAVTGKNYYKNTFTIGDKSGHAGYEYNKGGIVKTDFYNKTDPTNVTNADGTLSWRIKATIASNTNKLILTDELPDGITLEKLQGTGSLLDLKTISIDEDGNITGKGSSYQLTGTYTGQTVTVEITPIKSNTVIKPGDNYTIILTCKVDKDKIEDYESGKTYTFTNHASGKDDHGILGEAQQTQNWTEDGVQEDHKVIDKTGTWDNNSRRVKYSIKLNLDAKDIVEGSDILRLTDVFTYYDLAYARPENDWVSAGNKYNANAWLITDSVKLYKAVKNADGIWEKGEEITTWNWTVTTGAGKTDENGGRFRTSTLKGMNLPDETPMILEYDYQIQTDIPEGYHTTEKIQVSNSAALDGTAYKDDESQDDTKWEHQTSTGEVTTDIRGVLYKVSKGDYGKKLAGAVFQLQKYDGETYQDTGVTYTTDKYGKIVIQWQKSENDIQYAANMLYRVVETAAPDGYLLPSDPEANAFYFYFGDSDDTEHVLPENLPDSAVDLKKASHMAYVENASTKTEITVAKKWLTQNGDVDMGHTGSIRFELYQKESTKQPGDSAEAGTLKGEIKTQNETWAGVWKTISEESHPAGTKITFTIQSTNQWVTIAPTIYVNGKEITPTTEEGKTAYTYSFVMESGENVISGGIGCWSPGEYVQLSEIQAEEPNSSGDGSETERLYRTYEITSEEKWSKTISDLPASGTNEVGETVYYSYYVKEVGNNNYDVTYDNNDGIASGTITVTNKMSDSPSYELPKTGGAGTIWFTTVGTFLMSAALLCGYFVRVKRARRKRR